MCVKWSSMPKSAVTAIWHCYKPHPLMYTVCCFHKVFSHWKKLVLCSIHIIYLDIISDFSINFIAIINILDYLHILFPFFWLNNTCIGMMFVWYICINFFFKLHLSLNLLMVAYISRKKFKINNMLWQTFWAKTDLHNIYIISFNTIFSNVKKVFLSDVLFQKYWHPYNMLRHTLERIM